MTIPPAVTSRMKAIVGAVTSAVVTYAATAIINNQAWTVHGVEAAAAAALLVGLGVHQTPNRAGVSQAPVGTRTIVQPEQVKPGHRLGRHIEHDQRSRAFTVAPHPAPRSILWERHVHPYDQGAIGSCTGNAMAGALSTTPFKHRFTETRAVDLYEAATRLDDIPGRYPPDDTGSSGLAVAKAAQHAGYITSYQHCFTLDDVIAALQSGPCLAGTNWYDGMDTPDPDGTVHVTGTVRGGHEYELIGVDLTAQTLHAVNSWGTSWGVGGYFAITFADFTRLLHEQGDVTVPVR